MNDQSFNVFSGRSSRGRNHLINQAYHSIERSLHEGRESLNMYSVVKAKLPQLLQQANIIESEAGNITFDWSEVKASLSAQMNQSTLETLQYLNALNEIAGIKFKQLGFNIKIYTKEILSSPSDQILMKLRENGQLKLFGKSYRYISADIGQAASDNTLKGSAANDALYGCDGNDTINGGKGDDIVYGGEGNDTLTNTSGADQLYGGAGNDSLSTAGANGTLYGEKGNDTLLASSVRTRNTLIGGSGDDILLNANYAIATYVYNIGDGADTIRRSDGNPFGPLEDTVQFGANISFSDLTLHKQQNNLLIEVGVAENDRILIENFYSTSRYARTKVAKFAFVDGSVLNKEAVREGTELDDILVANSQNSLNYLAGMNGNDIYEIDMGNAGTTLINNADNDGGEDRLMLESTSAEDLWFYREMSHLI